MCGEGVAERPGNMTRLDSLLTWRGCAHLGDSNKPQPHSVERHGEREREEEWRKEEKKEKGLER